VSRLRLSPTAPDEDQGDGPPLTRRLPETWAPMTVGFLFATAWNALVPIISLQTVALGGDQATVGLVSAAHSVIPLVLAIPSGLLIRPRKVRSTMAGACGLAAGAMLLAYTARSPAILAFGLILFGGAQLGISLSTQIAILTPRDEARRQAIVGWYFSILSIGQIVGPMVGSQLAADGAYTRAMMFAAACMAVGCAAALLHSTGGSIDETGDDKHHSRSMAKHRPERSLVATLLAVLAAELVISGWTAFFPLFLDAGGSGIRQIGFYFSLRAIIAAGIRPFLGPLAQRLHPRVLVIAGGGVSAVVTAVMFQSRSAFVLTVSTVVLGVAAGLIFPLAAVVVSDALPHRLVGVGIGFRQITVRLGQLIGPLALGLMSARWQIPTAFLAYSGVAALMVASAALTQSVRYAAVRRLWGTFPGH
jgi:MFS family permease